MWLVGLMVHVAGRAMMHVAGRAMVHVAGRAYGACGW